MIEIVYGEDGYQPDLPYGNVVQVLEITEDPYSGEITSTEVPVSDYFNVDGTPVS